MQTAPDKILVLGARAPAALEWVRRLGREGYQVWLADSLAFPLARFSRYSQGFLHLPPPRTQLAAWANTLNEFLIQHQIQWVIPTCEEAFYLSHCKPRLRAETEFLCADFELMQQLHHKGRFAELSQRWSIRTPDTRVLHGRPIPDALRQTPEQWVFKPAYSRFANRTLIKPEADALNHLVHDAHNPWIAQRFVAGTEYCSYSLLRDGKLLAHCVYQPRYRAGQGSGMYFEPHDFPDITAFLAEFGQTTGYTGQVGFDFIRAADGKFWLLECNPRATSGIHLLANCPSLTHVLTRTQEKAEPPSQPLMVILAMLSFGLPHYFSRTFWRDIARADDVLWLAHDRRPGWLQLLPFAEILWRALRHRTGLLAAATRDIEWDGNDLPACSLGPERQRLTVKTHAYVRLLASRQNQTIRNLRTQLTQVTLGGYPVPCSINHGEPDNCYVVSPMATYIDYARYECYLIRPAWLGHGLQKLIAVIGTLLGKARLDDVTHINNWLLSTNLYPQHFSQQEIQTALAECLHANPDNAVGFRSLNHTSNASLISNLRRLGFITVPSRQVYLFDARNPDGAQRIARRHNNKIDRKLFETSGLPQVPGADFTDADFVRAESLYNQLYLEKYSPLNPQYTAQWLAAGHRDGWLELIGLRAPDTQLMGVVGFFALGDTLTAPIVGYDTSLPQSLGLYRQLTHLCIARALQQRLLLNFSSGAAGFKRLRGGEPAIEYSLVYIRHLPMHRRLAWTTLSLLLKTLGVPLMRLLKL